MSVGGTANCAPPRGVPFRPNLVRAVLISVTVLTAFPVANRAQGVSTPSQSNTVIYDDRDSHCKIVYLGIVGGLETPNNRRSGVVQIRDILQGQGYPDVCAKTFSPYVWVSGLHWVLGHFQLRSERLADDESDGAPKVIIVGHSLGGWAALSVARSLKRNNISVELTVQIDSVGVTDHTVPKNVKVAAIFHARDALMLLTTKSIKLQDPSQTRLAENIRVSNAGHESVTRDPGICSLVLSTVDSLRDGSARSDH
jgi:pimeloyl-ACP methyl ester carboxylesterase